MIQSLLVWLEFACIALQVAFGQLDAGPRVPAADRADAAASGVRARCYRGVHGCAADKPAKYVCPPRGLSFCCSCMQAPFVRVHTIVSELLGYNCASCDANPPYDCHDFAMLAPSA